MASKLISLSKYELQNPLEQSLRESYTLYSSQLTPPLKLITLLSPHDYQTLNKAILYGVLCGPHLSKSYVKYLHAIVNDGYCYFVELLSKVVDLLFINMFDCCKVKLVWVVSEVVEVGGVGFDRVFVSLLRQINVGDLSDGNVWLCFEVVKLLLSKWDKLLSEGPVVLSYGLYSFLRVLSDHCRSRSLVELKRLEIDFCVKMLREQFCLCIGIGRDLIRLLQDLVFVPEFRSILKDLVLNPSSFRTPGFDDVSVVYGMRTSRRYILLRISPEMETQLRFLLTHVKLGTQKRHQIWFARKFLFSPERESVIVDIVRFICAGHYPSNDVLQSDVIPRWAVIGWLLSSCTKKYVEANAKLALFYDWLFFDEKMDNVMNIEPAMLLMVHSIPRYTDMTSSLLEFVLLLIENYDVERKSVILNGVLSSINMLIRKGVIESLDVLTSCNLLSPYLREMLQKVLLNQSTLKKPCPIECIKELQSLEHPSPDGSAPMSLDPISVPSSVDLSAPLSLLGSNPVGQENNMKVLVGEIGEKMKKSRKMGQSIVAKILCLHLNTDNCMNSGNFDSESLACEVKKELDLTGYQLFSPLEHLPKSVGADDEVESVTAEVIRIFVFSRHPRILEMLISWSRHCCLLGARILSYALRLAYEAQVAGYGENHTKEISYDKMMPMLQCHVRHYFAFIAETEPNANQEISSGFKVDKKLISEMIDVAFSSYKILVTDKRYIASYSSDISLGKILSTDARSCSLWKNKKYKVLFETVFCHLSDISVGNLEVIQLLVNQLEVTDLVSIQIDMALKRINIFGDDVRNIFQLVRKSFCWEQLEQNKLWSLIRSELSVSNLPVEKLVLEFFFSSDLNSKDFGVVVGEFITLCSCLAPTPELVGAVMLLPDNKLPEFAAAVLSHWVVTNASMLFGSTIDFLDKLKKNNGNIALDWGEINLNKSAIMFLLKYLDKEGVHNMTMLDKLELLSDFKSRFENSSIATDDG